MSVNSWKEEFFYNEVKDVTLKCLVERLDKNEADLLLIEYSLTKWKGLSRENLDKHNLYSQGCKVQENPNFKPFTIATATCALCEVYYYSKDSCNSCPLAQSRDGVPCDEQNLNTISDKEIEDLSPYNAFTVSKDEKPMVEALEKAKRFVIKLKEIKYNASST